MLNIDLLKKTMYFSLILKAVELHERLQTPIVIVKASFQVIS
jgi:hypothetical protein